MAKRMVAPARDVPGKTAARICAIATTMAMPHVPLAAGPLSHRPLDDQDEDASPYRCPGDGPEVFGSSAPSFRAIQHADDGEDEGDGELAEIGSRLRLGQSEEQRLDTAGEHEEDREDGPRLDHDVEQLRLPWQEAAVLGQEQVTVDEMGRNSVTPSMIPSKDDGEPVGHERSSERHRAEDASAGDVLAPVDADDGAGDPLVS